MLEGDGDAEALEVFFSFFFFFLVGGGGGVTFHAAMRTPLLKFSKMPFALFVGTSKPLCNLYSV